MFRPRRRDLLEVLLGFGVLLDHPLRLVVELGLALLERLARVPDGDLGLAKLLPEFDRQLILRHGHFHRAHATAIAVARLPVAAAAPPAAVASLRASVASL